MKNFFNDFQLSLYSPKFYAHIKTKSLLGCLGYFFMLVLVLTLIQTAFLSNYIFVKIPSSAQSFISQAINYYPQELEININNGTAQTNVKEPYFIPLSLDDAQKDSLNNLVVIDTKTAFSTTQFEQYKTIVWLNKDSVYYKTDKNEVKIMPLSKMQNTKIDKSSVQSLVDKILPWVNFLGPLLFVLVFFGFYLAYSGVLVYLLLLALIIFLISKALKWGFSYKQSYKVSLYAITLPLLVDVLINITSPYTGFRGFTFMFSLLTLIVVGVNFYKSKHT